MNRAALVLKMLGVMLIPVISMMPTWDLHPRRPCSRCGGVFLRRKYQAISAQTVERVLSARPKEAEPLPDLAEDQSEEVPGEPWFLLSLYRCDRCPQGLVEGEAATESESEAGEEWLWLSSVCSAERAAAVEAIFPPSPWWARLLFGL